MSQDNCFLILGGGGLVGLQVAIRVATELAPKKIVIVSLYEEEVAEALVDLRKMFSESGIEFVGVAGNVFVREEFADQPRGKLLETQENRDKLYDDLFGRFRDIYASSHLVKLIEQHRPDVIVDAINTATGISYQDIYKSTAIARKQMSVLAAQIRNDDMKGAQAEWAETEKIFETLLVAQSIPQLIRHVTLVNKAMNDCGTRLYIKIGTSGTGGMGLNIPYTHGEDKPSPVLLTKTAVAFAHTGLLFLMARTAGRPIVKELKPAAMIGYADVTYKTVREQGKRGEPIKLYKSRADALTGTLVLRDDVTKFGSPLGELDLPVVDTGENGLFTRGEFEAITALGQMEFVTPEEIAQEIVMEIKGANTGHDVIAALDGAVMDPTYRAGTLRQQALDELTRLERETDTHSVALGILGPPELSKLLWEAELLRVQYGTLQAVIDSSPEEISSALNERLQKDARLLPAITSIGLPVLTPDGASLLRGPFMRIPEVKDADEIALAEGDIERWAAKGWVDLRAANWAKWQARFRRMIQLRAQMRGRGSAAMARDVYMHDDIRIGTIVGWVFGNEEGAYRIK